MKTIEKNTIYKLANSDTLVAVMNANEDSEMAIAVPVVEAVPRERIVGEFDVNISRVRHRFLMWNIIHVKYSDIGEPVAKMSPYAVVAMKNSASHILGLDEAEKSIPVADLC